MSDSDTGSVAGQGGAGRLQRVMGGFRAMRRSELGDEQLCRACGEYWPVDPEFFAMSERHLSYTCRACQDEQAHARRRSRQVAARQAPLRTEPAA